MIIDRNPALSDAVLLARRTTMRVDSDLVQELASRSWPDAVDYTLSRPPLEGEAPKLTDSKLTVEWWLDHITGPNSGLEERMVFFWHGLLTSHHRVVGSEGTPGLQLQMFKANATGNYRELLQQYVVSGAALRYLTLNGATEAEPNENFPRELMELFTLGIGNYTQADVEAAALAMTGWQIEGGTVGRVFFDSGRAYQGEVTFLGETKKWDTASIIDRLCDDPATAAHISSKIWYHFTGQTLDANGAASLGAFWQSENLEIKPLLQRIMLDDAFRTSHYVRPRSGLEFYTGVHHLVGFDTDDLSYSRDLGQMPYEPPNPAGWPIGDHWLKPNSMLQRGDMVMSLRETIGGDGTPSVDEILDRCGLYVIDGTTQAALVNAGAGQSLNDQEITQLRWRIALTSPEFQLQ